MGYLTFQLQKGMKLMSKLSLFTIKYMPPDPQSGNDNEKSAPKYIESTYSLSRWSDVGVSHKPDYKTGYTHSLERERRVSCRLH